MRRGLAPLVALPMLLAGCGADAPDPAETGQGGWRIPAGIYGDVAIDGASGKADGIELRLDKGSESETVDIVLCEGACTKIETRPLRRGLNGISFTLPSGGYTADVMIQPGGPDAVMFNIDWGEGLQSETLPKIGAEVGLQAAREAGGSG